MKKILTLILLSATVFSANARNTWHVEKLAPGLKLMSLVGVEALTGAPQHIHVVEADPQKGWELQMASSADKCFAGEMADSLDAHIVTTATFNFPHTYVRIGGELISGIEIDRSNNRWWMHEAGLAFDNIDNIRFYNFDGRADEALDTYKTDRSANVISSAPMLIEAGKAVQIVEESKNKAGFVGKRYARVAFATTFKGKILIVCVDGYAPGTAEGMTVPELQSFLIKEFSPVHAINMDGSCAMYVKGKGNVALKANEKKLPTFFVIKKKNK